MNCHSLLVLIGVLLTALNPSTCAAQSVPDDLVSHLQMYLTEKNIPGAMISIVRADSVLLTSGVGYADIDANVPVNKHHLFRQGSISKSFTALALLSMLKTSGHDLDSPVKAIDPDLPFQNPWVEDYPVRIAHLLEHSSGFEDFHLHAMYNNQHSSVPPIIKMVEDHKNSLRARWPSGTRKAYANPNYIVAGHLIEVLSGQSFHDYLKENLLAAIGMEHSGFYFNRPDSIPFAKGYTSSGSSHSPVPHARINGSPAGDLCANALDMAAFLQFMLARDSSIFNSEDFDRIETPRTTLAARNGLNYGYGLGNYSIWKNGFLWHGHGGQIDGFAARYLYSREANLGIAVAMNRNGNENALIDFVLDQLLKDAPKELPRKEIISIPDTLKEKYAGFYEFNSPKSDLIGFTDKMLAGLTLDFQGDTLFTKTLLGRIKGRLFYAGDHQFYYNGEGVPSTILLESPAGDSVFWVNDNYTVKSSRTKRLILFFGLLISFLLVAIFFVYSLIWLIRNAWDKYPQPSHNHLVLFGFGVAFLLMLVGFGLSVSRPHTAQQPTFTAVLMFVCSYAIVILAVYSVISWRRLRGKRWIKAFYVSTSLAALFIAIYFWDIGFVGLQLWNY